jgi:hypothetical protein
LVLGQQRRTDGTNIMSHTNQPSTSVRGLAATHGDAAGSTQGNAGTTVLIPSSAELVLDSAAEAGAIRFGNPYVSSRTDPLPLTVGGVLGGSIAVLNGLDLSASGFGQGDGIDLRDLTPWTSADPSGYQVTAGYDAASGRLTVVGDGARIATLTLPQGLSGMFSVARDGNGGTTLTLVHGKSDAVAVATKADIVQHDYGLTGAGVSVGVISDSFDAEGGLAQDIADGALPSSLAQTYNAKDDAKSGSDEGRAMAQIIHDIAPDASIRFATAASQGGTTDEAVARAIRTLVDAHVKVIVDDIGGWGSFYKLDSATDDAIHYALSKGVVLLTSATNKGGVFYENHLAMRQATLAGSADRVHAFNFGTAAAPSFYQKLELVNGRQQEIGLQWHAEGGPFHLTMRFYTQDASGAFVEVKAPNENTGTEPRYAITPHGQGTHSDYYVAITSDRADPHGVFKYIIGNAAAKIDDPHAGSGSGTMLGHQLDPGEIAVGSANYRTTLDGCTPTSEPDSAHGPGVLYEGVDGTAYAVPLHLAAPAIAAPDATSTTVTVPTATLPSGVGGLSVFAGTSAAAPAAAAVTALLLQANPDLNAENIRAILQDTALPMASSQQSGAGLVQADKAVAFTVGLTKLTAACSAGENRALRFLAPAHGMPAPASEDLWKGSGTTTQELARDMLGSAVLHASVAAPFASHAYAGSEIGALFADGNAASNLGDGSRVHPAGFPSHG